MLAQFFKTANPQGGHNNSRHTEYEIKNVVREADLQIYVIGVYEWFGSRARTPEELSGPGLLHEIAEQTGGRQFALERLAELPDVAAKLAVALRTDSQAGIP